MKSSDGRLRAMGSQLQIKNVVPSDGGVYYCTANNEADSDTKTFTLMSKSKQNNLDFSYIIVIVL